ncbi:MAG: WD40/YVTN/BNR-like repeat-containing protein [Nitrososphaeraceae archaeon]
MATHKKAPKRLYSSADDGYFESFDYGDSWNRSIAGLQHHYLHGLAVDSNDPENVVISSSLGAWQAYSIEHGNSTIYRRSDNIENWKPVSKGLPESKGTIISILCSNPVNGEEFYALNNKEIFSSTDSGISWKQLDII